MKLNYIVTIGLLVLAWSLVTSCQSGQGNNYASYQKTESGLLYKIHDDQEGNKIAFDKYIDFHMIWKNPNDSILKNTYDTLSGGPFIDAFFGKDTTKGGLTEGFLLLSEGDSATIAISSDTIANQQLNDIDARIADIQKQRDARLPSAPNDSVKQMMIAEADRVIQQLETRKEQVNSDFPSGTYVEYTIKVLAVKDEHGDIAKIDKYAQDNNLKVKSTESGLRYVVTEAGEGEQLTPGDSAKVDYVGKFMDGKVFDTSYEEVAKENNIFRPGRPYAPLSLVVGVGRVIRGWDEGLTLLKQGDKATFLIPSYLGYGPRGAGSIPPNTILVFDVEIMEVKKNNQ